MMMMVRARTKAADDAPALPKEKNLMASTWTEASKVRRRFKTGKPRTKDRVLTPTAAIFETCILLDDIRSEMQKVGLPADDVHAYLAVASEPKSADEMVLGKVIPIPSPEKVPDVFRKVEAIRDPRMLGIIFHQRDRDPKAKAPFAIWVHPFLTGPLAVKLLQEARAKVGDDYRA